MGYCGNVLWDNVVIYCGIMWQFISHGIMWPVVVGYRGKLLWDVVAIYCGIMSLFIVG